MIAALARLPDEGKGILFMIITVFLFSVMDATAKGLSARYDPVQVVWARFAGQTLMVMLMLGPRLGQILRTRFLGLQVVRSLALFGATTSLFTALAFMPLPTAIAVFQAGPLFVTILAFFVLHEPVGPRRLAAVGVGLMGALTIIRPGAEVFSPFALLPLLAAVCYGAYVTSTRFLGNEEDPWTSFLYTALFGTVLASLVVPFFWTTPTMADIGLFALMAGFGAAGHYVLIHALRLASASTLAPYAYVSLIFSTFWGFTLFADLPDGWTVFGALVIVAAGLYVWHRERRARQATP
ncbi:MAG: DMT family transporter [Pseudomonadota bacterium]